ncbi:hypothetical protein [Bradyrhizobium erythrophlei]|uniref:Uncharacterized protein n=1 Tax=Bradyrhizobium erythrophlei TaxID=1437360 RepID=A0A1M5NP96_9BRAD|nr:hypothetical protein [Bradyrhizobium erythrophlei]SHG91360.1 hypothetical protein SAMN05443248_3068 [Bradyrhizobium erythrophlei]
MKRLLRYNSRHMLHFPGDGKMPQLNPLSYSSQSKSGKRTKSLHEPLRMFRLRQRLFCFAGRQRCGERGEGASTPDTWDLGPDDNRTCSHCGSIHPDDLMEICRKTLVDDRYGIEGTTKSYKVYVRQPGVRNASEGAIKFYKWHAPESPTEEDQELFARACRVTRERFDAQWAKTRASAS